MTKIRLNLGEDIAQIKTLLRNTALAFIATNDHKLNRKLTDLAKGARVPVNVPDNPKISDFFVPATIKFGDVQIAISTNGRSPAMARTLSKRIEGIVSWDDLNQVILQDCARKAAKIYIPNIEQRQRFLHQLLKTDRISRLLKAGKMLEAKLLTDGMVKSWCHKNTKKRRP